ncbi:DUF2892 domain-containing protein [Corallococcus sp. H22C18031201]|uniref:YgaP family membrane protein n=1 Tax=Citreicoccus inhibens TaxID=2849499 RepID=UPI000E71E38B|nr:DUF2892 domain-containing protein [Citreicoccus inhibens]MBU8899096.1 DUF2892 domain-containing protein [Citreicoccus inhibens]RJS17431.1 DUF2892 domain-containing protein [Corallococcus sp. H22C18031201]
MICNESGVDRSLRVLEGLVMLALVVAGPRTPWGLVGLVPLLTGVLGYCPLYALLGVSTQPSGLVSVRGMP